MRLEGKSRGVVLVKGPSLLGLPQEEKTSLLPLALVISEWDAHCCCSPLASGFRIKQNKMVEQKDGKRPGSLMTFLNH